MHAIYSDTYTKMNLSQVGQVGLHCGNTVQDSDVVTTDNCSGVIYGPSNRATADDLQDHSPLTSFFKCDFFRTVVQQLT